MRFTTSSIAAVSASRDRLDDTLAPGHIISVHGAREYRLVLFIERERAYHRAIVSGENTWMELGGIDNDSLPYMRQMFYKTNARIPDEFVKTHEYPDLQYTFRGVKIRFGKLAGFQSRTVVAVRAHDALEPRLDGWGPLRGCRHQLWYVCDEDINDGYTPSFENMIARALHAAAQVAAHRENRHAEAADFIGLPPIQQLPEYIPLHYELMGCPMNPAMEQPAVVSLPLADLSVGATTRTISANALEALINTQFAFADNMPRAFNLRQVSHDFPAYRIVSEDIVTPEGQ